MKQKHTHLEIMLNSITIGIANVKSINVKQALNERLSKCLKISDDQRLLKELDKLHSDIATVINHQDKRGK